MQSATKNEVHTHIRWMIRRDMPEILAIENANFEFPWSEEDFIRRLRQRNCIGMVAERNERIVGHMVYELHRDHLYVLNLAVHASQHRTGVGTAMVDKLKSKLTSNPGRRNRITLAVCETNLEGCLFFKALGFRAQSVIRDYYEETNEDAITFCFRAK